MLKVCQNTVKFAIAHPRKKIRSSPTHQRMPWCSPACRGKGWQLGRNFACSLFVALMTRLASMARFLPSVSISDVATAHIFFLDFWTIPLKSKIYILSLSLSAANWGSFLKHWHLKFHFHLSEIIQMFSVNTQPSQLLALFSILTQRHLCREWNLRFGPKSAPEVTYFGNKFKNFLGEI